MVGAPNVDFSVQMRDVITARAAYAMNAHMLDASSQMQRMLIQTVV
jgi:flagellar basal body rod protein FlgC